MSLFSNIRILIGQNIWISIALLCSGIFLLKLSDSSNLINLIHRLIPSLSYSFVENTIAAIGMISLLTAFGTFSLWLQTYNRKRLAQRKNTFRRIAESMGWHYSEYLTGNLRPNVNSLAANRAYSFPKHLQITGQDTANFLSKEINGDLLIIFDCITSALNNQSETTTSFETIYSVVSDKLDLPYFHTQPETFLGDNALGSYLKGKAGVNDVSFPHRPIFSQKYVVDISLTAAPLVFTTQILDFYEQNQLPNVIGDGKTLALITWQEFSPTQNQINTHLQTLHYLFQCLKNNG